MQFLFNVFFWVVVILACGAALLHTQVGARFISSFSHYTGLDKTTKSISESRSHGVAAREAASERSDSIDDKLDSFRDNQREVPHREEGFDQLSTHVDQMNDRLDSAEARADAQRERMMAQKARMDEKAAQLRR